MRTWHGYHDHYGPVSGRCLTNAPPQTYCSEHIQQKLLISVLTLHRDQRKELTAPGMVGA